MLKKAIICLGLCCSASWAFAAPKPELNKDEVKRLNESAAVVSELRNAPDKGIPDDLWNKAECVVVFPAVKKAAFVVGGEAGTGVMSCRAGAAHPRTSGGGWSAPVFMHIAKGSVGFQIGAEEVDLVLLVMNRRGVEKLLQDKVTLGVDAAIAAGPVGRSGTAATDAQLNAELLWYSRARGLFGGIDLSGGVLKPNTEANQRAYGPAIKAQTVVDGDVKPPVEARTFVSALGRDVQGTSGRK